MKYYIPSKTFLAGEYSVLVGGAGLGLATSPQFEVNDSVHSVDENAFHPESPAGKYLLKTQQKKIYKLLDPFYEKKIQGGFGKSTAEYFSVALHQILQDRPSEKVLLNEYLSLFQTTPIKPSGVDLLFQYLGQVAFVDVQKNTFQSTPWRFAEIDFFIISTGFKIKTHEHLNELNLTDLTDLPVVSNFVIESYLKKSSHDFLRSLKDWVKILNEKKLTHESSFQLINHLQKDKNILLVKACGALRADVLIVFFNSENRSKVYESLTLEKLFIQASRTDLVDGVKSYVG